MDIEALVDAAAKNADHSALPPLRAWLDLAHGPDEANLVARAAYNVARLLIPSEGYEVAGALADRGIAAGTSDEGTRLRLLNLRAYCFLEQGRVAEALEPLLVVERTGGAHPAEVEQARSNIAFALLDLGDVQGATAAFQQARPEHPKEQVHAWYGLARCFLRTGQVANVPTLAAAIAVTPVEPRVNALGPLLEALVAEQAEDWALVFDRASAALPAFRAERTVEMLECLTLMARARRWEGRPAEADRWLAEAIEHAPAGRHRAPLLREQARVAADLGEPKRAIAALEAACADLTDTEGGSGRALRAAAARAQADVARVRELELSASHDALQRAYRTVEQRVAERTRDLANAVEALEIEVGERRAAEARALSASASKSEFLARMSHELRTPLNAILGYTELALEQLADAGSAAGVERDLGAVLGSARHLLNLVDDLLDLARVEAGQLPVCPVEVDLGLLVHAVVERIRPAILEHGSALVLDVDPELPRFRTDPLRLEQILQNLLSNAARHTRGGQVTLRVAVRSDVLRCEVADTGSGITPELLPRVFEPFVQGRAGGRAGIGLALVKHLVEALHGTITLDSEVGVGTTVAVAFRSRPGG